MRRLLFLVVLFTSLLFILPSCLTVEKKEYHFEFTAKNSGVLTMKYVNIMSVFEVDEDIDTDFNELINSYLEGDLIDKEFRFSKIISKRLYEENGVLCGEVKLEFSELVAAHLFQYEEAGPIMFHFNKDSKMEKYSSSNGNYGGEVMPVVFWLDSLSCLELFTNITQPDTTCISLLEKFKEWEKESAQ